MSVIKHLTDTLLYGIVTLVPIGTHKKHYFTEKENIMTTATITTNGILSSIVRLQALQETYRNIMWARIEAKYPNAHIDDSEQFTDTEQCYMSALNAISEAIDFLEEYDYVGAINFVENKKAIARGYRSGKIEVLAIIDALYNEIMQAIGDEESSTQDVYDVLKFIVETDNNELSTHAYATILNFVYDFMETHIHHKNGKISHKFNKKVSRHTLLVRANRMLAWYVNGKSSYYTGKELADVINAYSFIVSLFTRSNKLEYRHLDHTENVHFTCGYVSVVACMNDLYREENKVLYRIETDGPLYNGHASFNRCEIMKKALIAITA